MSLKTAFGKMYALERLMKLSVQCRVLHNHGFCNLCHEVLLAQRRVEGYDGLAL
jgi:hypothetical protein